MFSLLKRLFASADTDQYIEPYDEELDEDSFSIGYPNYKKIYENMKTSVGLGEETIDFSLGAFCPCSSIFKEKEDGSYEKYLCIKMTNDSQEHCYKASLRHELEHIKTGLALVNKIGLNNFVELQREVNPIASISFKTISEFMSWKAACEIDENEKISIDLWSAWKDKRYTLTQFCDVVAAHIAYDFVCGVVESRDERFSEESWTSIQEIGNVLKKASLDWPLTMENYHELGLKLNELLSRITEQR